MKTCDSCKKPREYFIDGVCYICKRADKKGVEVEECFSARKVGVEVKSKTGNLTQDNGWMRER